jgi:2-polyprenyl-3-methyl-5-hydroxy-6-metoxy-1,4-benzoquinol methylase
VKLTQSIAILYSVESNQKRLFCPIEKSPLTQFEDQLNCVKGHTFPIISGIPRFTKEDYSSGFGYQWKIFAKTQFDSQTKTAITMKRVVEACGEEVWNLMKTSPVLEVGCGAGRFTEVLLDKGAFVYSTDISHAIDVNVANFPLSTHHEAIQADVNHLPFEPDCFKIVFCLGVIQHTPDPEETIRQLTSYVEPGGWLIIDHYGKSLSWNLRSAPIARSILKRLPHDLALEICKKMYKLAKPFYLKSGNRLYRKVLNIVFPIVYFDNEIPELPEIFKDEWSVLDTFDSLTDWYKHRRSVDQISNSLKKLGLVDITCFENGSVIVARARKREISS